MAQEDDGPDLSCFDFGDDDGEPEAKQETREQTLKKHRQEEQQLRTEAKAKKHSIAKADRAARAAADAELEAALREMQARHAAELGDTGGAAAAMAELSVSAGSKPSKQNKRRQKKENEEREREKRMADEKAGAGPSAREVELERLSAVLSPLGLAVHEIAADGHSLYRSLAHQLQATGETHLDFQACRKTAADYIRSHPQDFLPYLLAESSDDSLPPDELISLYCATVESSSEWGGQLEITALSHACRRSIHVHSAGAPVLVTGAEYEPNGPPLHLAYHRHYYGLGEHYNSLVPSADR